MRFSVTGPGADVLGPVIHFEMIFPKALAALRSFASIAWE